MPQGNQSWPEPTAVSSSALLGSALVSFNPLEDLGEIPTFDVRDIDAVDLLDPLETRLVGVLAVEIAKIGFVRDEALVELDPENPRQKTSGNVFVSRDSLGGCRPPDPAARAPLRDY